MVRRYCPRQDDKRPGNEEGLRRREGAGDESMEWDGGERRRVIVVDAWKDAQCPDIDCVVSWSINAVCGLQWVEVHG